MKKLILTLVAIIIIATTNITVSAATPKYRTEIGVITCDGRGHKTLDVFYKNGQIHIFESSLVKKYKVGQIVKVKFATKKTKTIKDDKVVQIRKTKTNDDYINGYAQDYAWFYHRLTWKAQ